MGKADLDLALVSDGRNFVIERFTRAPRPTAPEPIYCAEMAELCVAHRQQAIARLLLEADRAGLVSHLRQSGQLRLEFLHWTQGLERDANYARHVAGTRYRLGPFLDALASGEIDLAKRITLASGAPYDQRYEYEDDHRYGEILFDIVKNDLQFSAAIAPLLARFEQVLEGGRSARFDICQALLARDRDGLSAALADLTREHQQLFRDKGAGIIADPDEFATERFILVEGLAIKVLATRLGIEVTDEDPLMPRQAFVDAPP